jgi:ATP-binding cassette subfamily B protein
VNSGREAAKMLAPRWPVILAATVSISLFAGANLLRPLVIQRAIDTGLIGGDRQALVVASIVFVALALGVYVFQAASTYTTAMLGQRFMRDLRVRLFSHYQRRQDHETDQG